MFAGSTNLSTNALCEVELTSDLDTRLANPVHRLTEQDSFDVTVPGLSLGKKPVTLLQDVASIGKDKLDG